MRRLHMFMNRARVRALKIPLASATQLAVVAIAFVETLAPSLPQTENCESPWLALNRCIAREEWTSPAHSWIPSSDNHYRR
jgi:hypothetical protein